MTSPLRILQLAQPQLDGTHDRLETYLDAVGAIVRHRETHRDRGGEPISDLKIFDYVVVCGGLTASGRAEEFAQVPELFDGLQRWMRPDDDRRRQIVVVPGDSDVRGLDCTAFGRFHDEFYGDTRPPFDPTKATVLTTKNLRWIVGHYWKTTEVERSTLLRWLLASLERSLETPGRNVLDYVQRHPTLLVTARTPARDFITSESVDFRSLTVLMDRYLPRVTAHLVGNGPCLLEPQPFALNHHTIGVHRTLEHGPSRLAANILELPPAGVEREATGSAVVGHAFLVTAGQDPEQSNPFRVPVAVAPDRGDETAASAIIAGFEAKLRATWKQQEPRSTWILGFPGAGTGRLVQTLLASRRFCDRRWQFEPFTWRLSADEDDSKRESRIKRFIRGQLSWYQTAPRTPEIPRPLVVVGPYYFQPHLAPEECRRDIQAVNQFFEKVHATGALAFFFAWGLERIEYLIRESTSCPVVHLGPLSDSHYAQYVRSRAAHVPLHAETVGKLTGKFLGFTGRVYDGAADCFESHRGSAPIDGVTGDELLHATLVRFDLTEKILRFRTHFDDSLGMAKIMRRLEEAVASAVHDERFDFSTIKVPGATLPGQEVRYLARPGVLRQTGDDYELMLPLPFVVVRPVRKVFASYSHTRLPWVRAFLQGLRSEAVSHGLSLDLKDYKDEDRPSAEGTVREAVHKVREYRNLLWFHSGGDGADSSNVEDETNHWREHWRGELDCKRAHVIPIVPDEQATTYKWTELIRIQASQDRSTWMPAYERILARLEPEPKPARRG